MITESFISTKKSPEFRTSLVILTWKNEKWGVQSTMLIHHSSMWSCNLWNCSRFVKQTHYSCTFLDKLFLQVFSLWIFSLGIFWVIRRHFVIVSQLSYRLGKGTQHFHMMFEKMNQCQWTDRKENKSLLRYTSSLLRIVAITSCN